MRTVRSRIYGVNTVPQTVSEKQRESTETGRLHRSAIKNLSHGVSKLVSAANKAMHAMNRRCAFLHISDPKQRCKLLDSLVLPILSYASEVWAVDNKVGESAEQLHWQFLSMYLALEAVLQTSLFWLSLGVTLYIFTGGSKFYDTTTASTTCLMMNASFSVLL